MGKDIPFAGLAGIRIFATVFALLTKKNVFDHTASKALR
jgi:hypothetical protein